MNWFEKTLLETIPIKQQTVTIKGKSYTVFYIDPAVMQRASSFGCAYKSTIFVRADLSEKVRRFVINHEVYHINDKQRWLGWFGSELRANVICGISDPTGLFATIKASLNTNRLKSYGQVFVKRGWWK